MLTIRTDLAAEARDLWRESAGETTRQTGHRVKALFLLGADDASLPLASEPEGLLSDSDRALLS